MMNKCIMKNRFPHRFLSYKIRKIKVTRHIVACITNRSELQIQMSQGEFPNRDRPARRTRGSSGQSRGQSCVRRARLLAPVSRAIDVSRRIDLSKLRGRAPPPRVNALDCTRSIKEARRTGDDIVVILVIS